MVPRPSARGFMAGASLLALRDNSATPDYSSRGDTAFKVLQQWYDSTTGLYHEGGWWNTATCLTTVADWAVTNQGASGDIEKVFSNTWDKAQQGDDGHKDFKDEFNDDNAWWALAFVRAHDAGYQGEDYLGKAAYLFDDMGQYPGTRCGGGIMWKQKDSEYINAIANELYLTLGASLANRVSEDQKQGYVDKAKAQWEWFKNSGMIDSSDNLINDGLDTDCKNNGKTKWSYNQGVVLGGLVELSKATGDDSYIQEAKKIASSVLQNMTKDDGVLVDSGCGTDCGGDIDSAKGIFVRYLMYLHQASPEDAYTQFFTKNADSIWDKDRNDQNQFGNPWQGADGGVDDPDLKYTASAHCSAFAAFVAAVAVTKS